MSFFQIAQTSATNLTHHCIDRWVAGKLRNFNNFPQIFVFMPHGHLIRKEPVHAVGNQNTVTPVIPVACLLGSQPQRTSCKHLGGQPDF